MGPSHVVSTGAGGTLFRERAARPGCDEGRHSGYFPCQNILMDNYRLYSGHVCIWCVLLYPHELSFENRLIIELMWQWVGGWIQFLGSLAYWAPTFVLRQSEVFGTNDSLSHVSLIFGAITCVTGILGTFLGPFLAKKWEQFDPASDALICAAGGYIIADLGSPRVILELTLAELPLCVCQQDSLPLCPFLHWLWASQTIIIH